MSSESELRDAIRSSANIATTGIDTEAVVRRARARRVPKQLAFSSLSVLAVVGVAALGITTLPSLQPGSNSASDSAVMSTMPESPPNNVNNGSSDPSTQGPSGDRIAAVRINSCGHNVVAVPKNDIGLTLTASFPRTSPANGQQVSGSVTLTNTSMERVKAFTPGEPAITLSRDGVTVWHSYETEVGTWIPIDLAPGQSIEYPSQFVPVLCTNDDELAADYAGTLPPLPGGHYQASALMFITPDQEHGIPDILVGGPSLDITLTRG